MKKEIHMICNAHIDPIWQWDWPEGASATLSTFASAVKLAKEFDYIFCHNEVTVYKYVEEYAPQLFEEIKELVKQGKWHIMGGWYLQPDCNMPTGESFIRQAREGQRYFKEKFGIVPTTAINFDPFGHSVGLVQVLKKCGYDSYLFMRPNQGTMDLPDEQFIWRGLDGSEVKANRFLSYGSALGNSARQIKERADAQDKEVCAVLWGVGNHGGGPSRKDLRDIKETLLTSEDEVYIHSTPEQFFAKINPTAVFDKSLVISMPGCYTTMHKIKSMHAKLENEIYLAEKFASVAYAKGLLPEYPQKEIQTAVEDLLNAQFHDILPGSSIQCGEEGGLRYLNHGLLEAGRAKMHAYFALSQEQKVANEGEYPIVVFNPHPYEIVDNVECEFMLADQNWDESINSRFSVVDEDGNPVPYQVIKEESNLNLDWRKRIIFEAKLAPLSQTRYSVYARYDKTLPKPVYEALTFDNGRKHVEIDKNTGLLTSYKIDGKEYLSAPMTLTSFDDNADPWGMGAEQRVRLGTNEQPFSLLTTPDGPFKGMQSIQVIEDGDIYLGVEAFFKNGNTRARIAYKIYKNNDYVDIDVNLYLTDINKIIKLKAPFALSGEVIGQTVFGTDKLFTDARENVAHRFIAVKDQGECITLMNDSVYGSHYENGALYMSLVRGATYCAHPIESRELIPSDKYTKKIDQGENNFSFRLCLLKENELERKTSEFIQKPYALNIFPVATVLDKVKDFAVSLGDDTIALACMKKADDRDAIIFRLQNNTSTPVSTHISVNGAVRPLSFGKYEVKTVVYENGELTEITEMII
ncbi:MAG: alpha-mannosidase [Clostridia bacterium]|nr:alpha-mannosidase [Clostridia bacterium]